MSEVSDRDRGLAAEWLIAEHREEIAGMLAREEGRRDAIDDAVSVCGRRAAESKAEGDWSTERGIRKAGLEIGSTTADEIERSVSLEEAAETCEEYRRENRENETERGDQGDEAVECAERIRALKEKA